MKKGNNNSALQSRDISNTLFVSQLRLSAWQPTLRDVLLLNIERKNSLFVFVIALIWWIKRFCL